MIGDPLAKPEPGLFCVIPAAGRGERLRSSTGSRSKLFLELPTPKGRRPLLQVTLELLADSGFFEGIVLAVSEDERTEIEGLVEKSSASKITEMVSGGATRQQSVANGLEHLVDRAKYVAIHDAARPFLSIEAIESVLLAAKKSGAALLTESLTSTLKEVRIRKSEDAFAPFLEVSRTLPRENFQLAQTPQVFEFKLIHKAHKQAVEDKFEATDDAQLVERSGHPVTAVDNQTPNPKITSPSDLPLARILAGSIRVT